jgi:hypothetical protein
MATHTDRLELRLDPDLKRLVAAHARELGISTSAAARLMIVGYLRGAGTTKGEGRADQPTA